MGIHRQVFDRRFRPHWRSYLLQSLLATSSVFVVLVALRQQNLVVAASLAATAFTVFTMPSRVAASTRNVIGGHIVGLLFGSLFALTSPGSVIMTDATYALAVGCAMLVMAATNTEHPPAAGTALGVAMAGFAWRLLVGVVVGAVVLSAIHRLLQPVLRDLIAPPKCLQQNRD